MSFVNIRGKIDRVITASHYYAWCRWFYINLKDAYLTSMKLVKVIPLSPVHAVANSHNSSYRVESVGFMLLRDSTLHVLDKVPWIQKGHIWYSNVAFIQIFVVPAKWIVPLLLISVSNTGLFHDDLIIARVWISSHVYQSILCARYICMREIMMLFRCASPFQSYESNV